MKHIFIINPNSGVGNYKKVIDWIAQNHTRYAIDYDIIETQYPGHAIEIASGFNDENTVLYAAGGDGTLHEVLNGMGLKCQLCVLPVGTGNDFWRMIDFKGSIEEIVEHSVVHGHVVNVDVGVVNGRRYINCANFGLDSAINRDVNESRPSMIPRNLLYMYFALRNIFHMKPVHYQLEMNGESFQVDAILTSIMNGRWYGNGFKSAPDARFNDGLLDICIADPLTIGEALGLMPKYMKGTHIHHPKIHMMQTTTVRIQSESPILYGLDGEIFEDTVLDFSVIKHGISLRIPNGIKP